MSEFPSRPNNRVPPDYSHTPWGLDPDGCLVFVAKQLPEMPSLERVVIGEKHIEVNGWIFPYERINKPFLQWFQHTLVGWACSSYDPAHRQWIEEVVSTFQERLSGTF